jgi:type IV pilus assembly protein PilW
MFAVGDRVIATPSANPDACLGSTLNIDRVTASDSATSTVTTAYAGITASEPILYNLGPGPNSINASPIATMPTNGPTVLVYAVRNGSLTVCDFSLKDCSLAANAGLSSVWVPQADNVVSMRAAYWQDTSVAWDGSSSASNQTSPTTACNWAKVKALHLVLVTRSDQREKEVVTNSAVNVVNASAALSPAWNIAALNTAAPIVLGTDSSSTDQEWRHYRYKAFQALIPLRNITWMGSPPAGC